MKIQNPVLRGFNPDPSFLRVGDDYYLATSTFEWFPGVQIHHSKDLVNWQLLTHPLTRMSQLNLIGCPNSGGVWAPCLSHDGQQFYLLYSNVKCLTGVYKDTPNYVITAQDIHGPWSEPVYVNSSGFDPSLFHDDDGRKWLLNMVWDHRKGRNRFHGINLQEYCADQRRLIGPVTTIFKGTSLGGTEGPHLYKKDGFYYLMVAEGGTSYNHAVTVARSRNLTGPYEVDPCNPVLTSKGKSHLRLQKAGHASLVETQTGEWYIAHLCARPVNEDGECNLGRETAIQRCEWNEEGWLRVVDSTMSPQEEVEPPNLPSHAFPEVPFLDHFDETQLSVHFSTLRDPAHPDWLSLTERPGWLRIRGRESLNSLHRQSMVARRLQSFKAEVETCLEFTPDHFQQMAGLIAYYNTENHYYLHLTHEESKGPVLQLISSMRGKYNELLEEPITLADTMRVWLKVHFNESYLQFYYSMDGSEWNLIGPVLDAAKLSDEYATISQDGYFRSWGFTGTFVGMCVQDLSGQLKAADFDYFSYREWK
ncbi:glycoside hydrolase family 43 protein [Paenibacillus hexagrammi]|uniref:Glycoside hydrolase family 43 protein n=1 Tax=Paenibacillus hexagrammi TaxID=2908839 RepID=A0ABY3SEW4_9BACL|nr:glycoside hydrolase family 43 protein [Paenibacillus sp. YPD9-1]UJF31726.1 glycoside hydrolase family 43 protein [Paenibacillus sp. YPD9-1]